MKILHTGDWHLGKRLGRFSRLEEQREVMAEIVEIAERENVDVVLLAGDVYDVSQPPAAAMELLSKTIETLSNGGRRPIVIVAGNHDSPTLIDAHRYVNRKQGVLFYGFPNSEILPEDSDIVRRSAPGFVEILIGDVPLRILTTPYANEQTLGKFMQNEREERINAALREMWAQTADKFCDENGINVLLTHLYFHPASGMPPAEPDCREERTINYVGGSCAISTLNVPEQIQYCAVGHLHRYQILDGKRANYGRCVPVVYSGSPLAYSMSEAGQRKYVLLLNLEPNQAPEWKPIELTQGRNLRRIACTDVDEALEKIRLYPNEYLEIVMTGGNPLSAPELNLLHGAHEFITEIILSQQLVRASENAIDVQTFHSLSVEEHFVRYYEQKFNVAPDVETLEIFRSLMAAIPN
ncbi:MAG: exonuclease subunit SbcD [Bacteroidia bacterium]|nr:exonuclease subunit SbcD [Bacteroidia bacterium]MDW8333252.1 exonuclease subunit SbcD [Bacteroidia bacterium]